MTHFHSPSPRLLAVPGIGYPQNIAIDRGMPDLPIFRERSEEGLDLPARSVGWLGWLRSPQPWIAERG